MPLGYPARTVLVVSNASSLVLERELLDRVAAAKTGDPLAPILIVVPSRRLADHVSRRLVERFGAVLGVEVVHHAGLARRIVRSAGLAEPRSIESPLLETLTRRVVRRSPSGRLIDFFRERPAAVPTLMRSLVDLREGGVAPAAARAALGPEHAEIGALYARWTEALEAVASRGGADPAALAVLAAPHAAAYASRFRCVLHHGSYELIGVHEALVAALDRGRDGVELRPSARGDDDPPLDAAASFFQAQGALTELTTAARMALAAVRDGVPPHEVAIVVRSFGAYAAAMDVLIDSGDVPWETSYARALRRDPAVARTLAAIAAMADDAGTFASHAAGFEQAAAAAFGERWSSPAGTALAGLLRTLAEVETLLDERAAIGRAEAAAWLEGAVDAAVVPAVPGVGVRVLDAMQARGLTFEHVLLSGMNSGIFPYVGREDPFLPDDARRRVMEATGHPLPLAARREREEHLLLGMMLGSARKRLVVSWRRADEAGRPATPSLALRDVARATGRGMTAKDLEDAARRIPAHPGARFAAWAADPGLLRRDEETLLVALQSEAGADAAPAVAARAPGLRRAIDLVVATDAFSPGSGRYDGRIGPGFVDTRIAATALEVLGACPLQFFFRHVLDVHADPQAKTPFELDAATTGTRVHKVLHHVYGALAGEDAFTRLSLPARVARARQILGEVWPEYAPEREAALAERFPLLDGIVRHGWQKTLMAFIAADLERLEAESLVPVEFEVKEERTIPGGPPGLVVKARYDRIVEGAGGRVIGDYKTGSSKLDKRLAPAAIVSGAELQVPLYALLEGVPVELLGVGPRLVPDGTEKTDPRFVRFPGFDGADQRDGVIETIGVLAHLAAEGTFPIRVGDDCAFCDYRTACRRHHPPTEHRESVSPDVQDAVRCWEKKKETPLLAQVGPRTA
ncbi:MAG TPA: PD-(D/E)XK nuclease family protein [Candidatus Polarisedimenticolaceae bacterium]|nr:PD-(D/E)XK nuclease family protein [Candidatus Polarisedimenticolaceae bacterium]